MTIRTLHNYVTGFSLIDILHYSQSITALRNVQLAHVQ